MDIIELAETLANWKLQPLVKQFQDTTRKHFNKGILSTSNNSTISENEYLPGGTATIYDRKGARTGETRPEETIYRQSNTTL